MRKSIVVVLFFALTVYSVGENTLFLRGEDCQPFITQTQDTLWVRNDTEHDFYPAFTLQSITKDKAHVILHNEKEVPVYGVIDKNVLTPLISQCVDTIILYASPSYDSQPVISKKIRHTKYRILLLSLDGDWLYIRFYDSDVVIEGWLSPDTICSDPYSQCTPC